MKKEALLRDYDIILYPLLTEKTNNMLAYSQYFFAVPKSVTKTDIKDAVERLFKVKVESVNTLVRKGKKKIFKGIRGERSDMKRGIVSLKKGYKIELGQEG
ncbi:MAG: 50S ribosomal protein L23 [Alphaproteobacteria bacterium]